MHPYFHQLFMYRPRKLTWNRKMMVVSRNLLFQGFIFRWTMLVFGGVYYIHDGFKYPDGFKIHFNIYIYIFTHKHDVFIYPDFGGCMKMREFSLNRWGISPIGTPKPRFGGPTLRSNWSENPKVDHGTRNPPTANPASSHYSLVDWNDEMIHEN